MPSSDRDFPFTLTDWILKVFVGSAKHLGVETVANPKATTNPIELARRRRSMGRKCRLVPLTLDFMLFNLTIRIEMETLKAKSIGSNSQRYGSYPE